MKRIYSVIKGTGAYVPERRVTNQEFVNRKFYDPNGQLIELSGEEIINKFESITEIVERRYVTDDLVTSDIAYLAALDAIETSGTDKESFDYIIVAHNFGDVRYNNKKTDMVPSIAARVKEKLGIINPDTVCYDTPFGCPGWLQGIIQADYYLRSGDAKRVLVIGAETLSRISDPFDRDSMIYADGAGAAILEGMVSEKPVGVLAHSTRSDTLDHARLLWMGKSNNPSYNGTDLYLKMNGRKLYEYALNTVPQVVKETIEKAGIYINNVAKILIHQANAKMDEAILKRIFRMYKGVKIPKFIMPMTISRLGNSSVATIPTLLNMIMKEMMPNHYLYPGNIAVFASVGAGMNVNTLVYKMPG